MARAHGTDDAGSGSFVRGFSSFLLLLAVASLLTACGGDVAPAGVGAGGGGGVGGGVVTCASGPAPAVLNWDPAVVVSSPLAGYRVYYGTASGSYQQPPGSGVDTGSTATTYTVTGLASGTTYYFVVTAYDTGNNESVRSNEVCKTIS